MLKIENYINGGLIAPVSDKYLDNYNPATGEVICEVAAGDKKDIDRAVKAARRALDGEWGRMSLNERLDLLARVSDRIMERFDEFLDAEMADTGKPHAFACSVDVPRGEILLASSPLDSASLSADEVVWVRTA